VLDRVLALLKKAEPRRRFFLTLDNVAWFGPLENARFFETPYPPEKTGSVTSDPQWPQAQYLINIADRAAPEVAGIIRRLGPLTENTKVQADFLQAALRMPLPQSTSLVNVFRLWLRKPPSMRVPTLMGKLCSRWASNGQTKPALFLLDAILRFDPPTRKQSLFRTVVPRIHSYGLEMVLKEVEQSLVTPALKELFNLLCRRLHAVIRAEHGNTPDDFSWIWMKSLTCLGDHSNGLKEILVAALLRWRCLVVVTMHYRHR